MSVSPLLSSSSSPLVSPELLGVLSSIAAFMALMALFFLYLSNKLSVESPNDLTHLSSYKNNQQGTQHTRLALPQCMAAVTYGHIRRVEDFVDVVLYEDLEAVFILRHWSSMKPNQIQGK